MYLLGATLTKILAMLAAVMTMTAGMPRVQCRCPDGQIKFFCQGNPSSPSGCCCAADDASSPDVKTCCCAAKKHSCCTYTDGVPQQGTGRNGPQTVVKAACCLKTLVTDAPVYSVTDTNIPDHQLVDTLVFWEPAPDTQSVTAGAVAVCSPPGFQISSPDFVIILCHFNC
jgi:hypothetical protein